MSTWCRTCNEWTVPLDNGVCGWCDHHTLTGQLDAEAALRDRIYQTRMRQRENTARYRRNNSRAA